jgi:hypothetical protein
MSDTTGLASTTFAIYLPVQMLFNAALGWVAWKMRSDRAQITSLEDRVHETTVKLIDERMRAISHEVKAHAQSLVSTIDDLKTRLQDGDQRFEKLGEKDHSIELKTMREILEFQKEIARDGVTRKDLKEHQDSMSRAVESLRREMQEAVRHTR